MPSCSKPCLIRRRISRATTHCSSGMVLMIMRIVTCSADSASTPQTSGSSRILALNASSARISLPRSCSSVIARSTSAP